MIYFELGVGVIIQRTGWGNMCQITTFMAPCLDRASLHYRLTEPAQRNHECAALGWVWRGGGRARGLAYVIAVFSYTQGAN